MRSFAQFFLKFSIGLNFKSKVLLNSLEII